MTDAREDVRWRRALAVVDRLLELPPADREAALAAACGDDAALAADARRWLAAQEEAAPLLEWPAARADAIAELGSPLEPGTQVGAWRVLRVAGAGGMGTVYEAERADGAFARRAALKVVRHVGDLVLLSARLRRERDILAALDHPGIARLLDGGVTAAGLPYYVMEFVEGTPIDAFCDARRLGVDARLALFRQVCDAVRFAHQRLVVHRDLKPSNILVTGAGEVKLLDFGIAALLDAPSDAPPDGAPRTLARLLTPEYASPEQRRGEPTTVAADIWSLGVVLHELLVGRRPLPAGDDAEPVPPSALTVPDDVAAQRDTTPARLRRRLRGDVDTIVVTALRPSPARRYGSAEALGGDVAAHAAGLPIRARPDGWAYRTGKFVARHRVAVAVAAAGLLLLAGTAVVAVRQARRAARAAERARESSAFVVGLLEVSYPFDSGGGAQSLRSMLDSGAARLAARERAGGEVEPALLQGLALGFYGLARFDRAAALAGDALARRIAAGDTEIAILDSRLQYAEALRLAGRQREALVEYGRALPVVARTEGAASPGMAQVLQPMARANRMLGRLGTADSLLDLVERIIAAHPGRARIALAHAHQTRGHLRLERGDLDAAEREYATTLAMRRQSGANPAEVANSHADLAVVARQRGRLDRADSLLRLSLAVKRAQLGELHPEVADDLREQGALALARGDARAAEHAYREALLRYGQAAPVPWWRGAPALVGLGTALARQGRAAEADSVLRDALAALVPAEDSASLVQGEAWRQRGLLAVARAPDSARAHLGRAARIFAERLGEGHARTRGVRQELAQARGVPHAARAAPRSAPAP